MKFNFKLKLPIRARKKNQEDGSDSELPAFEKPAKAYKGFRKIKSARYVLFIGDEGAILVYIKGGVVQSRQFVPDASQQSLDELRQTFAQDEKSGLTVVMDSMDQSHVQQTLPPVSALSVGKLIKRRLERDFGNDTIKGAVQLGRDKGGRKDWQFMMVALENSPQLTVWLDFIAELPHRLRGIHTVSIEAEVLVKHLERAMGVPKEGTGAKWKFFVSHNKVGGFRQVILHNGHIIFTRLAQPVGEFNPEVIAGNIEQEILGTTEYLKRLSFNPADGLDIYIIASSGIKTALDRSKFSANNLQVLTPYEVAEYLEIEGAAQPTDQFGDVILASVIGLSTKHVLTLTTPLARKINSYYQLMQLQRGIAALAGICLIGYIGSLSYDIYMHFSQMDELAQTKTVRQQSIEGLRTEAKNSKLDIEKANDLLDLYQQMQNERVSPIPFFVRLFEITKSGILVTGIDWTFIPAGGGAPGSVPPPAQPGVAGKTTKTVLTLEFPKEATADMKVFNVVAKQALEDFKSLFKGYTAEYTGLPSEAVGSGQLEIDFNAAPTNAQTTATSEKSAITLTVTGPYMDLLELYKVMEK